MLIAGHKLHSPASLARIHGSTINSFLTTSNSLLPTNNHNQTHLSYNPEHLPYFPWLKDFITQHLISIHSRTSINIPALNSELVLHPDGHFVNTLIDNLINGCDIGYTGPQFNHRSRNLHSAYQHPTTLDATIAS